MWSITIEFPTSLPRSDEGTHKKYPYLSRDNVCDDMWLTSAVPRGVVRFQKHNVSYKGGAFMLCGNFLHFNVLSLNSTQSRRLEVPFIGFELYMKR
jgi:hypothetical protein